jgi:hypothetical protein
MRNGKVKITNKPDKRTVSGYGSGNEYRGASYKYTILIQSNVYTNEKINVNNAKITYTIYFPNRFMCSKLVGMGLGFIK